jgi:hypothetical protein
MEGSEGGRRTRDVNIAGETRKAFRIAAGHLIESESRGEWSTASPPGDADG